MCHRSAAAASHLVKHSPQYIGHLLLLHDAEWENLGRLEQTIRTGRRAVDRANRAMSMGVDLLWRRKALGWVKGSDNLDLCAGTLDLTLELLKRGQVTALDFSPKMLDVGRQRLPVPIDATVALLESRRVPGAVEVQQVAGGALQVQALGRRVSGHENAHRVLRIVEGVAHEASLGLDRKSTRLNSSHRT